MEFREFVDLVYKECPPSMRLGQFAMTILYQVDKERYNGIMDGPYDPFYNDNVLRDFFDNLETYGLTTPKSPDTLTSVNTNSKENMMKALEDMTIEELKEHQKMVQQFIEDRDVIGVGPDGDLYRYNKETKFFEFKKQGGQSWYSCYVDLSLVLHQFNELNLKNILFLTKYYVEKNTLKEKNT